MIIATFFMVGVHFLVKTLADFHVFQIIFFRSVITSSFCIIHLHRHGQSFIGKRQGLLFLRALFGILSMALFFITLQRMPMGASVTLKYLSPVFTAIFAVLLLRERVRAVQGGLFLAALIGVVLLKGFDVRIDTLNLILGIVGALFGGLVYVVIRKIGQREHPMVIINYFMFSAAVLAGFAMIPFWRNPNLYEWLMLFGIGVFGYYGQVYMTRAFQLELASRVAPIKYLEVIYSLIIGLIWFDERYTTFSFLGILLIVGSMLLNLMFKQKT